MSDALALIWAQANGGVIGANGDMSWHLPEDAAHFRRTTTGAPVLMGRATWESLPERFRPLPGRTNIIVSRQAGYRAPGALVVTSIEAGRAAAGQRRTWVIGGAQIYAATIAEADLLVVTEIDLDVDGDAYAPEIGPEWSGVPVLADGADGTGEGSDGEGWRLAASGVRYRFLRFTRTD
ncbi:dihydrofolate reductase [Sanguibacter gelidistatuariae]|uniref:dihydrofolate reductase n=1 Tax=Sanguibacter gelidistatuariae TaxID=1814289 RepID=A0A1G6NS37_9MICO|nr:dihydrofolate reductase [Sanguibacter gelidistatuariae]SDC69995.1 dihydrofolate reductase [Sanguibacter gelidistatuariae]